MSLKVQLTAIYSTQERKLAILLGTKIFEATILFKSDDDHYTLTVKGLSDDGDVKLEMHYSQIILASVIQS